MTLKSARPSKARWKQSEQRAPKQGDAAKLRRILRAGSVVDEDGCWIWQGPVRATYAFIHKLALLDEGFNFPAQYRMLHKLACWIKHGDIAWSMFSLHRCDKHLCVRPECTRPGTHNDNMADAVARNRIAPTRAKLIGAANHAWRGGTSRAYRQSK